MASNDEKSFHEEMMRRAIGLSRQAVDDPNTFSPFGAVIVQDIGRKILGEGCNTMRKTMDPSEHGEVVAIRNACQNINSLTLPPGCTLYTSCEPCPMCASLIVATQIDRVFYANAGECTLYD